MRKGVAVGLNEVRASEIEEIALGGREVVLASAECDTQDALGRGGQGEGDLILDPERAVELAVDCQLVELAARGTVSEAGGASIVGLQVALDQGIFRAVTGEGDMEFCPAPAAR